MKRAAIWLGLMIGTLGGCSSPFFRLQSPDEDRERTKVATTRTVGDVTSVWGADPVELIGVGVVRGLPGTGGHTESGELRRMVIHDLKQRGVEDPAAFLEQPDTAIVVVRAELPGGIQQGEVFDVTVELPERDRTPSLRGAQLMECELREFKDKRDLTAREVNSGVLKGKVWGRAKGPILVGLGEKKDKDGQRRGKIWSGGRATQNRDFALILNKDDDKRFARDARLVAMRVNDTFNGSFRGAVRNVAEAKHNKVVTIRMPPQYKLNTPHFFRVVRKIPLRDSSGERARYIHALSEDLLDSSRTIIAALKLEALGQDGVEPLKRGLESKHYLVRFCSAESLAYLGEPCCAEHLAALVEKHPPLRAFGLTALASLDAAVCHLKLRELLSSNSAETCYGAFRALRTLDETDDAVAGQHLNNSFYLHQVASDGTPLVHISTTKRAEIVLFGKEQKLVAPFSFQGGPDFVITAGEGDEHCLIHRVSVQHGQTKEACSLMVGDVIQTMARMGAIYPDVVELLQQAGSNQNVSCRVAIDALPQKVSVYSLVAAGARDKAAGKQSEEDVESDVDFGRVPELFEKPGRKVAGK